MSLTDFHLTRGASRFLQNRTPHIVALLMSLFTWRGNAIEAEDVFYYRVGNVSLRPSFSISQNYNDNVFFIGDEPIVIPVLNEEGSIILDSVLDGDGNIIGFTPRVVIFDRVGDFITTFNATASLLLGNARRNYLLGNYRYSHRFFQEYDQQNAGVHNFSFRGNLDGAKIDFAPSFSYNNSQTILSGSNRNQSFANRLIERNAISGSARVTIRLTPKTFTTTTMSGNLNDFVEEGLPFFDSDHIGIRQGFGFQFRPKLSLSAYGSFGRRSVSSNDGRPVGGAQTYFGGGFSAEGDFSRRFTGTIRFGIQQASFSKSSESLLAPTAGITLQHLMGRDFKTTLSYTRSTFIGIQNPNELGVTDRVNLTISKPFGTRKNWMATIDGNINFRSWEDETGSSRGRSDTSMGTTFSLQYRIQEWLSSGFSYSFQSFSSNQSGQLGLVDYDVNSINLSLRVGY